MENIALAFSGGGYRAACFSLGSLSYLNRIKYKAEPLLKKVTFISSTSGGSITNLLYSSYLFRGKSFDECYTYLLKELDGEKLIARALQILNSSKEWKKRPDKSRNIINAFSIAYDDLFEKQIFGLYADRQKQPHLEEICVNSTEFTNGLPFRFQSQHPGNNFPNGKIGNRYISFKKGTNSISNKLKLADILASSSCFPSGFEPLIFPNDYSYANLSSADLSKAINFQANMFTLPAAKSTPGMDDDSPETNETEEPAERKDQYNTFDLLKDKSFNPNIQFGIMDGGVTDNQAIDAFKLADTRRKKSGRATFDLFIACDVSSYLVDGYTLPMEKKKWYNRFSINFIITTWVLMGLALPIMYFTIKQPWKTWMYIAGTISGLMLLPVLYLAFLKIKSLLSGNKPASSWGVIFNKYKKYFFRLRIGVLKQMIRSRIKSVFIMVNDIYLKQIRRMYYDELFGNPDYTERTIQNTIYDLSKVKFPVTKTTDAELKPSEAIIDIAEAARNMGTTLWFDEKQQKEKMKEKLVVTGQFTTCYSLLKYLNKKEESTLSPELQQLKKDLEADWEKFCKDPYMMISSPISS
jgi:Patatin-like phospholipase